MAGDSVPFAREWGLKLAMEDLHAVVERARRGGRKVILGGHSLGASMAVAYAAWDFGGRPGHRDLSGLVLMDGGLLGTFTTPDLAGVKRRLAALQQGDPFLDLLGIHVPWASGVFSGIAALYARVAPDARATFVDYPLIPAELKAPFPVTNEGGLGYAFDSSTSPDVLSLIHVRAGALAPSGDPRPWQNGEVTPIQNVAKLFGRSPVDATEWYFPNRLSLDVDGASALGRNAVTNYLHLRVWHKRTIHVPLYAIQTVAHARAGAARRAAAGGGVADPGEAREAGRRVGDRLAPRSADRGAGQEPLPQDRDPVAEAQLLIGGELVAGEGDPLEIENPALGEVFTSVALPSEEQVDAAIAAARDASRAWAATPALERGEMLHEVAARIRAKTDELAETMTREGGKPRVENADEIGWTAAAFDYYAEMGRNFAGRVIPPIESSQLALVVKEPMGVVACIVPWNYPLLLLAWKLAPALAAGNACVCKPSELTPLSTLALAECFDVLPPGVVNLVPGGGDVGARIVADPRVDCVAFTGSVETGQRIAHTCVDRVARINLELGGKDPFIVCADVAAEIEVAARGGAWAAYLNAGQVCTSAERFYVEHSVYDDFLSAFVDHARSLRVGDPLADDTDMGPMVSEASARRSSGSSRRRSATAPRSCSAATTRATRAATSWRRRSSPARRPRPRC